MSKQESLQRHRIIIQKLKSKDSTFDEILDKLQSESDLHDQNFEISQRTFQRDLKEINSLYGIEIKFNRSQKVYYIHEDLQDQYSERMFEALDIFQVLKVNQSISEFIQFDTRKPLGTEHLSGILYAIQNKFQLQFRYKKFYHDQADLRTVEPYLLKEFKERWYVLAFDLERKEFRTFGLDRLFALNILTNKFQHPQNFNPKEYYQNSYGIVGPSNGDPIDIKLKLVNNQGEYIRTLPLHHSQEILKEKDGEMTVKLHLIPTYDFVFELMSMGENLKVIHPKSLATQLKKRFSNSLKIYEKP